MASLKEIFEKAQQTGQVEYTFFGGGTNITPFNQTSIPFTEGTNKTLSSKPPYIRLGYEGSFPGDFQFRTDDPTNTYNTLLASTRDTARIGAFFTDIPKGPLWLAKQSTLQFSNPDVSYKKAVNSTSGLGENYFLDKLDQINGPRFYNPILGPNTLASVAGNALGLHFTRHGLSPLNNTGYEDLNTINTVNGKQIGSRLLLYKYSLENFNGTGELTLNKYFGGPSSFFGLGNTKITAYRQGQTNKIQSVSNKDTTSILVTGQQNASLIPPDQDYITNSSTGFTPWTYLNIKNYSYNLNQGTLTKYPGDGGNTNKYIQDFRQETKEATNTPESQNYPKLNIHNRIGVTTGRAYKGASNTVDSINVLTITPSTVFFSKSDPATIDTNSSEILDGQLLYQGLFNSSEIKDNVRGKYGRDIIKFRIELLNNDLPVFAPLDNAGQPDLSKAQINTDVLAFRAYLADMSDDITPQWKSFNYMGRGEDFYVYEKFSRSINFSFYIFAHSEQEMPALYTKLNYLMSSMAPDYNDRNQMRGTYAYLTIGDYIYRQPGVFNKMSISSLLDAPWEIALEEPENRKTDKAKQLEVPKYMKVSMGFNPIHNFLPRKNKRTEPHTATFITPNWKMNGVRNYYLPQGGKDKPPLINVTEDGSVITR